MRRLALPVAVALTIAGTLAVWTGSRPLPPPLKGKQPLTVLVQPGPLTYDQSDPASPSGLEYDLIELFADELDVEVQYLTTSPHRMAKDFSAAKVHLAAAWLTPGMLPGSLYSPPFLRSNDLLVQHEASLPIDAASELAERQLHVLAGSRQAMTARGLKEKFPNIDLIEHAGMLPSTLLEAVASGRFELAIVDEAFHDVALQFAPALQATLKFPPQPITWAFPEGTDPQLIAKAEAFLKRLPDDPVFARLKDRYFGHIRRLDIEDISKLLERSRTILPKLKPYFVAAQIETGFDWRLLAALAYQESQWEAHATSPTGVRGIMMLTAETADRLNVSNRLDPEESIRAGARYLDILRSQIPESTPEPDRTWQAMAAYNIGPGHFNAARTIGRQRKADVDSWLVMKGVLPLLARPEIYERLKSGRARGGEAVILVENVRSFYDILSRQEAPYRPLNIAKTETPAKAKGAKPKAKASNPGIKKPG